MPDLSGAPESASPTALAAGPVTQGWAAPAGGSTTLELLGHLAEAIHSTLDLESVLQSVTDTATRLAGAAFGAFFYDASEDDGDGDVFHLVVLSGAERDAFAAMPAPRITALFQPTFDDRETVRIADVTADPRFSALPPGHLALRSYLATPVTGRDGQGLGALLFGHPDPDVFSAIAETRVTAVAAAAAIAVENARLFEREQAARERAEWLAFATSWLNAVTASLATATSAREALLAVRNCTLAHGTDGLIGIGFVEGGTTLALHSPHPTDDDPTLPWSPVGPDLGRFADLTATGAVAWPTRSALEAAHPDIAAALPEARALVALPLQGSLPQRGALVSFWAHEREFSAESLRIIQSAADQVAASLQRIAHRHGEQAARDQLRRRLVELTEVSRLLQRSLLPQHLAEPDGLDIAVRYVPAAADAEVGGDWYDVVSSPDGTVTVVVGDVEGHSYAAATVMGEISSALRAYLSEGHPVDVALELLNPTVELAEVLVTCCLVNIDPRTGEVAIARAGHPLPIVRTAAGTRELEVAGGPPLGIPGADWPVTRVTARAGDRVVLYTDGLVERRRASMEERTALLADTVAGCAGPAAECADAVLAAMGTEAGDDTALVVADLLAR
ncbi:GAF domain-containing protein [Nocardioides sp. GY 10113]|uniref:GAF domain-containing SpoIIE family protein phosphatase n=1 Tax=Nocardioides sp. GY 10113 TaxID=2569761 RepID=UPI0010A88D34|nr:GAF domain-containing SpoIIE family protein phosphatase [Nocardioides sp. GY 10113]TIC79619.1 GAF domain-containing protein [Nocardioides sp. GY 10113]TIC79634.1 GAF domain-containing protein [Nocardioides sp. GY 10113]